MLITAKLAVLFDEPYWVGIYERQEGTRLEVCKITFGADPKDYEVYRFLNDNWKNLSFSPPVSDDCSRERSINPKRMQREISNQLQKTDVGTKAQQALKLQQEQKKQERKSLRKKKSEEEKERQFELSQQKKKEKHKGR